MEPGSLERCRPRGYQDVQQRPPRLPAERRILWLECTVNSCTCLPPAQPVAASQESDHGSQARHRSSGACTGHA